MKQIFCIAALMCIVAFQVNAQNETPKQKCDRIVKAANDDPSNWQKQWEAARVLLDKDQEYYDQEKAMSYYERIYKIGTGVTISVPDSIINEAVAILMIGANTTGDINKVKYYSNEMIRLDRLQNNGSETSSSIMARTWTAMYNLIEADYAASLADVETMQKDLKRLNYTGVENTEVMQMMVFESYFSNYKKQMQNKLLEVTFDGKKYVLISTNNWTVEQPFIGWMENGLMDDGEGLDEVRLFYCEDGNVTDDVHGQLSFSFYWQGENNTVATGDENNTRLITVTPEQRQKMIDAYKAYISKKAKGEKK